MRSVSLSFASAIVAVSCAVSCTGGSPTSESPASSSPTSGAATVEAAASAPAASVSDASTSEPDASASAVPSAASASASAVAEEPIPDVTVKNIGIHIGGGPTDEAGMRRTKGPIRRSVEPHFDAFKRCFAKVEDPSKGGDVSVDIRIEKAGGKAELKKFRSALKGEDFEACLRAAYEAIDFEKPADGATMVSYSLRFTPSKK